MELTTGSLASAARLALQVVVDQKRPVLEIYHELRNEMSPEQEIPGRGASGRVVEQSTVRWRESYIQFTLVNIGGGRAEGVTLHRVGDFPCGHGHYPLSKTPIVNGEVIPQMPPGQAIQLFHINCDELYERGSDGKPGAVLVSPFVFEMRYSGPAQGLNRVRRWWARLRKTPQYRGTFAFDTRLYDRTLLPPARYL